MQTPKYFEYKISDTEYNIIGDDIDKIGLLMIKKISQNHSRGYLVINTRYIYKDEDWGEPIEKPTLFDDPGNICKVIDNVGNVYDIGNKKVNIPGYAVDEIKKIARGSVIFPENDVTPGVEFWINELDNYNYCAMLQLSSFYKAIVLEYSGFNVIICYIDTEMG